MEIRLLYKMKGRLSIWKGFLENVVVVCAVSNWQCQGSGCGAEEKRLVIRDLQSIKESTIELCR